MNDELPHCERKKSPREDFKLLMKLQTKCPSRKYDSIVNIIKKRASEAKAHVHAYRRRNVNTHAYSSNDQSYVELGTEAGTLVSDEAHSPSGLKMRSPFKTKLTPKRDQSGSLKQEKPLFETKSSWFKELKKEMPS